MNFVKSALFEYNLRRKRQFAYGLYGTLGFIVLLALLYILFFQNSSWPIILGIKSSILHIIDNIRAQTLLGLFYASSIGGLFFVTISLEAVFVTFLKVGYHWSSLLLVYIFGLFISYTINYFIGQRLAELSLKLITPKKFYKIKGVLNKYGVLAIFVFNVLPLPSQPLSTILGVFKYNKLKFYTFFLLGQMIKYALIIVGYTVLGV